MRSSVRGERDAGKEPELTSDINVILTSVIVFVQQIRPVQSMFKFNKPK